MTFGELLALTSLGDFAEVCTDSRLVRPGDVFVAIEGTACDGHDFIAQAAAKGAKYVVCRRAKSACGGPTPEPPAEGCEFIEVDDTSQAAGLLAQARWGNPAESLVNLAVTGTNGKTTVAFLVRSCLQQAGKKCGLIGTVIYDTGIETRPASLTTPDCQTIAGAQRQMLEAGAEYMVIEASSHALAQNRLAGIEFAAAAFTNLSGDHLDFHKTKEHYLAAKTRLFSSLEPGAAAVLNRQAPESETIRKATHANILWYAIEEAADLTARIESMSAEGTIFHIEYSGRRQKVVSSLVGRYNVANHLAAAGLCLAAGLDLETIAAGLAALSGVPGRLENIQAEGFSVIVDFAHTDDALKNVLMTLKPLCTGKLIVVFGCGGDRDRTKRPRMARVAEELADRIFVTSDNPRSERPEAIIDDILTGFVDPYAASVCVEADRKAAVERAIDAAGPGDIVVIAGKGHETYQIIGDLKFHFSDQEVVQDYLRRLPCRGSH